VVDLGRFWNAVEHNAQVGLILCGAKGFGKIDWLVAENYCYCAQTPKAKTSVTTINTAALNVQEKFKTLLPVRWGLLAPNRRSVGDLNSLVIACLPRKVAFPSPVSKIDCCPEINRQYFGFLPTHKVQPNCKAMCMLISRVRVC